jgi:hypothetical protein
MKAVAPTLRAFTGFYGLLRVFTGFYGFYGFLRENAIEHAIMLQCLYGKIQSIAVAMQSVVVFTGFTGFFWRT